MMLERIDTRINMSDHFTKGLSWALFHQHADYSLGHIPPVYLPIYKSTIGTYTDQPVNLGKNVPLSFTTPMPAAAARVFYGEPLVGCSLAWLAQSYMLGRIRLWGGVTVVRR